MTVDQYIKRDYAPLPERARGLINHLRGLPGLVEQARANLSDVAAPVLETAIDMLKGAISFMQDDLPQALSGLGHSDPSLQAEFGPAQTLALEAQRGLLAHFTDSLAPSAPADFAKGPAAFSNMLRYGEAVTVPLERLLEIGQADLAQNKAAFVETAARIDADKSPVDVVKLLGQEHPTLETLVQETDAMLEELRQWVIDQEIVSLPYDERCVVAETPKFLRFAFAMMDTPGPFEPVAREAFYYVTPPESDWPPDKQEEWLTQFDYCGLRDTSIHEAWPGHYLHALQHRNSPSRTTKIFEIRICRSIPPTLHIMATPASGQSFSPFQVRSDP